MITVDYRTRTDDDVGPVDPSTFFAAELPALIAAHGALAVPGAAELAPRPLAFDVEGTAWTLALVGEEIVLTPGSAAATAVLRLDREAFSDLVNDVRSPMGFFTDGSLDLPQGRLEDALDWGVILRSLVDGRPVHTTGAVTFRDRDGAPLDLHRRFRPDDDTEEMAHFLGEAGFLAIRGLFTTEEMAGIDAEIDAALDRYQPDDGRSWWAKTAAGEHRAVRLEYFHEESPATARLLADDRLAAIGRLTVDGHVPAEGRHGFNVVEALIKPIGVIEGISDVPWHKDCSLGGHSLRCCSMTVGISVTGADAESGQLRVVAGSHRALIQPAFLRRNLDLPQIDLPTETGDVTVHLSCTLHMSQPPVERERRVLYTSLRLPQAGAGRAGLEKVGLIREGAYKTVSQKPAYPPA